MPTYIKITCCIIVLINADIICVKNEGFLVSLLIFESHETSGLPLHLKPIGYCNLYTDCASSMVDPGSRVRGLYRVVSSL